MGIVRNIEDLKQARDDMQGYFDPLFEQMLKDEKYYDLDFADALRLPIRFKDEGVVLPTAREVVDTAVDHITPGHRRISVPRRAATPKATEQARKLTRFYEALLNYFENVGASNPYRECNKHLTSYGIGVYKLLYDQRKRPPEPKRIDFDSEEEYEEAREEWRFARSEHMPFSLQVPNPTHILFDPFNDPPQWVIEVSSKYVYQVQSEFPSWPNENNLRPSNQVEVIEYWDDKFRAVMVDGQSALKNGVTRHKWRVHPYIIGSSGLGYTDSENRPEKKYVGLLRYIRQLLESESRQYSVGDIVLKASAWPVRALEGERANEMPTTEMEYGKIHALPPGVKIQDLTPQLPPQMVFDFMNMTNSIISGATAPRVVRGLHQPGLSSGFDRQLALGEARLRYGSIARAQQKMLQELCRKAAIIAEAMVKGPISLNAGAVQQEFLSINASDFKGHYAVVVEINVVEPEDEIRKHQDGVQQVTAGVMSPQDYIRIYRPDVDPDSEMGRILAARLLFSPQMMQLVGGAIIQKVGQNLSLDQLMAQILGAAQGGTQPQRMAPNPGEGEAARGSGSRSDQAAMRELDLRETGR